MLCNFADFLTKLFYTLQPTCVNGYKDIDFLVVHVLCTLCNLKLHLRTKLKSYVKNCMKITTFIKVIHRKRILITCLKSD